MGARHGVLLAAVLMLGLATSSCGDGADSHVSATVEGPATFDVEGKLTMRPYDTFRTGDAGGSPCVGKDGYDDIQGGAPIIVRNSSGDQVGLGELEEGTLTAHYPSGDCEFDFKVTGIKDPGNDEAKYSVEVAQRGQVVFTRAEADSVALSLG